MAESIHFERIRSISASNAGGEPYLYVIPDQKIIFASDGYLTEYSASGNEEISYVYHSSCIDLYTSAICKDKFSSYTIFGLDRLSQQYCSILRHKSLRILNGSQPLPGVCPKLLYKHDEDSEQSGLFLEITLLQSESPATSFAIWRESWTKKGKTTTPVHKKVYLKTCLFTKSFRENFVVFTSEHDVWYSQFDSKLEFNSATPLPDDTSIITAIDISDSGSILVGYQNGKIAFLHHCSPSGTWQIHYQRSSRILGLKFCIDEDHEFICVTGSEVTLYNQKGAAKSKYLSTSEVLSLQLVSQNMVAMLTLVGNFYDFSILRWNRSPSVESAAPPLKQIQEVKLTKSPRAEPVQSVTYTPAPLKQIQKPQADQPQENNVTKSSHTEKSVELVANEPELGGITMDKEGFILDARGQVVHIDVLEKMDPDEFYRWLYS
jgi:hypothetical protein